VIQHFTGLSDLSAQQIHSLIERAVEFSSIDRQQLKKVLPHSVIANVFFEPSTRTRISFEMAAKLLGSEVINFDLSNSSVKKGETLYDTLRTLEAIGCDAIVLRHSDDRIFETIKEKFTIPLINAGAGRFEHPSQGLLDLYTLKHEFGKLEGLNITILGDVKHSRVAGTMIICAQKLGLNITICAPENFIPAQLPANCKLSTIESSLPGADAVMCLRNQFERHELVDFDAQAYHREWGLTLERAQLLARHAIIMHPAPINRGMEIADELVETKQSRIFQQMTNGVYSRMSILEWILKGTL
jgi:aspartate carbamoyltransferase catalytic subunit